MSDDDILRLLMKYKEQHHMMTSDVMDMLNMKKSTYHKRVSEGGWKYKEICKMKKLGIVPG